MTHDFIEVQFLVENMDSPTLRIVDARSTPHGGTVAMPTGKEQYAAGHIPGAVHLDYDEDLKDPSTPYAVRVAPPELFGRVIGEHGIGHDSVVVAYDAGTIPFAARMVWMLRYYGHSHSYVLAGGINAWTNLGYELTTEVPVVAPAHFTAHAHPRLRATLEEVTAIVEGRSNAQLVETQRDQTYAQRDRDIKGAVRISGNLLLEDARGGRVASPETLARLIREARLDPRKRTVVTCGSGVSASGAWLALREAGFSDVAVYDGSWMEWNHLGLPTKPKRS